MQQLQQHCETNFPTKKCNNNFPKIQTGNNNTVNLIFFKTKTTKTN